METNNKIYGVEIGEFYDIFFEILEVNKFPERVKAKEEDERNGWEDFPIVVVEG
jgi:hypothetical protein